MSGVNSFNKIVTRNVGLSKHIRSLHATPLKRHWGKTDTVARREGLNGEYTLDLHYEFHYRGHCKFDDWDIKKNKIADASMGIVLAFVIYKCVTEPEHIFGEFEYPDATKWTDEELGVPPAE
ncbi:NADH dehydrogenase [ubiquinone] 1 beta subcomplex subunit 2, mitochondrial-like [Adelges cooleyi]|uniref:NADH dehydrogenase [ubiquinone] 1 beta subcomplex subunit 2, mitochondrial-like n=1 Tax=Adelges cooleyi TaxID=133065 RepID=UPI00217F240D|nr:NADH dehydrogenase [ubiquinone] 1 beta subcomplex subunit 2, mitochondrial-like [Adelges cooleyi]